jgi:hypothetical protein
MKPSLGQRTSAWPPGRSVTESKPLSSTSASAPILNEHFFVVPGHEVVDIETVIESHEEWIVLEKAPEVREIVEATDPRTD